MKRNLLILSSVLLLVSCNSTPSESSNVSDSINETPSIEPSVPEVEDNSYDVLLDEDYSNIKELKDLEKSDPYDLMYDDDVFGYFEERSSQQLYINNVFDNEMYDGMVKDGVDAKYLFYSDDTVRFVDRTSGYAFNLKTDKNFEGDFSLGKYRSKIYNDETTLTISKETKNPYKSWSTYRDEWLIRYINNEEYLKDNNLSYTEDVIFESTSILPSHCVSVFSIKINNPGNIKKMYYNIGIVRDEYDFNGSEFYLFVMKSSSNKNQEFKDMLSSFYKVECKGDLVNHYDNMELVSNPLWSEDTKKYFDKLVNQERTDWGIYTANTDNPNVLKGKIKDLEEAMDYEFEIVPTYQHLLSGGSKIDFPTQSTINVASGNGFNGKKVLQFSYQFTSNNNNVSSGNTTDCYTPMFDILRGEPQEYDFFDIRSQIYRSFKLLAEGLKSYKEPVLFRLNNEMNTDWTSYCGLMTLIDPDIFAATWRCLYNYLEDKGVNNTIWIFNPVADTTPYSAWGEDMCYFPGVKYVQALGLTYYEDNNNGKVNSTTFRKDYTKLYNKNYETWKNYPWIISEFGCGAGGNASGERYRNQSSQTDYVLGMFEDFNNRKDNPYLQNIKGAVWFSVNDLSDGKVTNQYELVIDKLPTTIQAFKEGLAKNK